MQNELKQCECVIGLWLDFEDTEIVTEKGLLANIDYQNRNNKDLYYIPISDYFDDEKAVNFDRFVFCPFCGKKIDWDAIRRRATDENN